MDISGLDSWDQSRKVVIRKFLIEENNKIEDDRFIRKS